MSDPLEIETLVTETITKPVASPPTETTVTTTVQNPA